MKVIEAKRLYVRSFKADDWKDLKRYISKEEVIRFEPGWDPSEESLRNRVMELAKGNSFWAVELKTIGRMIGHIFFDTIEPKKFQTWMLGYIFDSDFHGNGYAIEA